ncbi:MAG: hypothetical protein ACRDI3_01135 [Actinomycetota bacterium]
MKKTLLRLLVGAIVAGFAVLPGAPAIADPNPCSGSAPGPHCRPLCFYEVVVHPGDPANGVAPSVEIRETFC